MLDSVWNDSPGRHLSVPRETDYPYGFRSSASRDRGFSVYALATLFQLATPIGIGPRHLRGLGDTYGDHLRGVLQSVGPHAMRPYDFAPPHAHGHIPVRQGGFSEFQFLAPEVSAQLSTPRAKVLTDGGRHGLYGLLVLRGLAPALRQHVGPRRKPRYRARPGGACHAWRDVVPWV